MDYEYFTGEIDLQWNNILQKYLQSFSCQNEDKTLTFDEILNQIFVADNGDQEVKYEDKEICEKCILEALNFLSARNTPPVQTQIYSLLNIAKYMSKDETCLINLNMNNVLQNLIYLTQPTSIVAERSTKFLFIELLNSCLEHQTGIKWVIETKYWMYVYKLILEYQKLDVELSQLGYDILTRLLEKTIDINEDFSQEIIKVLTEPLVNTALQITNAPDASMVTQIVNLNETLRPSLNCLIEILERLLQNDSCKVLNRIINLKIGVASDTISQRSTDKQLCLILERITIILSFYGLTEIFDGIKTINQDPLVLSGFVKIINNEVSKGALSVILQLYHYGIKYSKCIYNKLPKYHMKGKSVDIESGLITLQLEPIVLIGEKFQHVFFTPEKDYSIRSSHLAQITKRCSWESLQVGFKIKGILPICPFEIYTLALESIIKSKDLYSKENLGAIFEGLVYCFDDMLSYVRKRCGQREIGPTEQVYVMTLLTAVLMYIEDFDFNWGDSVKALDLPQIMYEFLSSFKWPTQIIVKGLSLMKEAILKRLSPCMSLLIDSQDVLKDIGPMLYRKCFNSEWEIRKAVLDVVWTIAINANKSFSSFKDILVDASLPNLIATMALNDENTTVKATAFKCLQEIIVMEDIEHNLSSKPFINKVLDILATDIDPVLQTEAIHFIQTVYKDESFDTNNILHLYKCLERVALYNSNVDVAKAAMEFWKTVTKKYFINQGWIDSKFPPIVFSKRIVNMTKKEVHMRVHKILTELGHIGCLNIFQKLLEDKSVHSEVREVLWEFTTKFYCIFQEYDITPESMLINQEFLDLSSFQNQGVLSPRSNMESDEIIQELLNDTVMNMFPDEINFCNDEDVFSVLGSNAAIPKVPRNSTENMISNVNQGQNCLSPGEFVDLIIKTVSSSSTKINCSEQDSLPSGSSDVYNIIDY